MDVRGQGQGYELGDAQQAPGRSCDDYPKATLAKAALSRLTRCRQDGDSGPAGLGDRLNEQWASNPHWPS
jgi:hypothetical protein